MWTYGNLTDICRYLSFTAYRNLLPFVGAALHPDVG